MIHPAGKTDTRYHFTAPAAFGDSTGSDATGRGSRSCGGSWIKRATGLFAAGLLVVDGAYGRALTAPEQSGAGTEIHKRSLLAGCPAYQSGVGAVDPPWLQKASPYVHAVASGDSWVPARTNCTAPYSIDLSYTFSANSDALAGSAFAGLGQLNLSTQDVLARDFDDITSSVGLTFTPHQDRPTNALNLAFLRNTDVHTKIAHWGAEKPGYVGNVTSHVVYTEPAGTASSAERLAGLAFALGLKAMGAPGTGGFGLPIGHFGDTALSSVTASKDNPCWPATRLGPLDLAFLAARHGAAPMLHAAETIAIGENYGNGGLLLAANSPALLAARYAGKVTISLAEDGSSATHIGESVILLAPGSQAPGADASVTQGAWIIGNDFANTIIGSAYDDFFTPGSNTTVITMGAGADSLLIDDRRPATVRVLDFDPQHDTLWVTPNTAPQGAPAAQVTLTESDLGAVVKTPHGATIQLRNHSVASLPSAARWIRSGVPKSLDPFKIDLCQHAASAPSSGAKAPAPTETAGPVAAPSQGFTTA